MASASEGLVSELFFYTFVLFLYLWSPFVQYQDELTVLCLCVGFSSHLLSSHHFVYEWYKNNIILIWLPRISLGCFVDGDALVLDPRGALAVG